jgi:predicted neuraminidase
MTASAKMLSTMIDLLAGTLSQSTASFDGQKFVMTAIRTGVLLVIASGFALAISTLPAMQEPAFVIPEYRTSSRDSEPVLETAFISGDLTREVHSATAVELNNGDIRVFWYGGKREGSKDTSIYSRVLNSADNNWADIDEIMTRDMVSRDTHRYIRKLGNPVAVVNGDELWLFFVSVSVGGWAGSSLNLSVSADNGNTWGPVRRLISSPFINISTLVRNAPLVTENGDVLLPAYHEFLGKFSELLRLDKDGNVIDKYRISHGREAIQPAVLPVDTTHAIAYMRNTSDKQPGNIWFSRSQGSLADWTVLEALTLPNPDSAVTAVQLNTPDEQLLVFNNHPSERDDISMAYRDGSDTAWQLVHRFETIAGGEKMHNPFSYPFLLRTRDGNFHLFYTWKRKHIKHIYFNNAALLDMLPVAEPDS